MGGRDSPPPPPGIQVKAEGSSPSPLHTMSATEQGRLGIHGGGWGGRAAGVGVESGGGGSRGGCAVGVGGDERLAGVGRDLLVGMAAAAHCHGDPSWHHGAAKSPTTDHGSTANDDQKGGLHARRPRPPA